MWPESCAFSVEPEDWLALPTGPFAPLLLPMPCGVPPVKAPFTTEVAPPAWPVWSLFRPSPIAMTETAPASAPPNPPAKAKTRE